MSEVGEDKPKEKSFLISQATTIRGGLMGAAITAFISWNTGKYNRIGLFMRRWRFVRYFITAKLALSSPKLTSYNHPPLSTPANNFYCYSGQPGIGKSHHFQNVISAESKDRPTLYVSFKSTGRETNFEMDLSEQLNFGEHSISMIAQIIGAVKRIHNINCTPWKICATSVLINAALIASHALIAFIALSPTLTMSLHFFAAGSQLYFLHFITPFIVQAMRKTVPVIVFDDLNKIEHLNMLPQIVRFLKLVDDRSVNIMLVSSDQETWSKLRREPGMKDRLRVRQIRYDHIETANLLIGCIDRDFNGLIVQIAAHSLFDRVICRAMVRELIGVRQMSLRRFISLLKLTDEEEYERMVEVLVPKKEQTALQIVTEFTRILLESEMENIVSNIKTIKRELRTMPEKEFLDSLNLLLEKRKLPSDSQVAANLKVYNVVRDLRSEYVINGRFTYIVYQLAVQEYIKDMKEFEKTPQDPKP